MSEQIAYSFVGGMVLGLVLYWLWNNRIGSSLTTTYSVPQPSNEANITFTCTTHKRIDQFQKTMVKLLRNMKDLHLIKSWVVIDDGSSLDDRITMQRRFPFITFVGKGHGYKKHPHSLNILLYGFINTPYWLQFEDDWDTREVCKLGDVMEVLKAGNYSQVGMNRWGLSGNVRYDVKTKTLPNGTKYHELNYKNEDLQKLKRMGVRKYCENGDFWSPDQPAWPLFSLNPSLNNTQFFKGLLPFDTDPSKNAKPVPYRFEMEFACKFIEAGGSKASMDTEYIKHMEGISTSEM